MPQNERNEFAKANTDGKFDFISNDPTPKDGASVKSGELALLAGKTVPYKLSNNQAADLQQRQTSYVERGGVLFSNKEVPKQTMQKNYAAKNGYDPSELLRLKMEKSFPNNSVAKPIPQPAPTPIETGKIKPVSEMSSGEKIEEALTRMIPLLPDSMREKVESLLTPEAIGTITVVLAAWAVGHAAGVSEVIDALAIIGLVAAGAEAVDIGQKLYDGVSLAINAQTNEDLDLAAKKLADGLGGATVDVAAAVVLKKTGGAMENGINNLPKMPSLSPQLATPNGIIIPAIAEPALANPALPIWTTPAAAPSTVLLTNDILGKQKPEDNTFHSK